MSTDAVLSDVLLMMPATGLVDFEEQIQDLVASDARTPTAATRPDLPSRQFSDFALTSHLHAPQLRLVYLPLCLLVTLTSIPDIPEGFEYTCFIGAAMRPVEVLDHIIESLGIRRVVLHGAKNARIEYILKLDSPSASSLSATTSVLSSLEAQQCNGPPYRLQMTLSKEWFAKIGTVAAGLAKGYKRPSIVARTEPSPSTNGSTKESSRQRTSSASTWRPSSMFGLWSSPSLAEEDESEEDQQQQQHANDTIKAGSSNSNSPDLVVGRRSVASPRTVGGSRLSSLFDGWLSVDPASDVVQSPVEASDATTPRSGRTRMVSEPINLDNRSSIAFGEMLPPSTDGSIDKVDTMEADFESLMADLGIKGPQQAAMRQLSVDRKQFLIQQHQQRQPAPLRPQQTGPAHTGSTALAGLKRLSMAAIGSSPWPAESEPASASHSSPATVPTFQAAGPSQAPSPLVPQHTASGWTSWFAGTTITADEVDGDESPRWFAEQLKNGKVSQKSLVKHLIALRVRLSTAKLSWIKEFMDSSAGVEALAVVLERTTVKRLNKHELPQELDESVQVECIKCLRVLMNTEVIDCLRLRKAKTC